MVVSCKFWFYFYFFLFKSLFPTSIPQPKPSALRVPCAEGLGAEAAGSWLSFQGQKAIDITPNYKCVYLIS